MPRAPQRPRGTAEVGPKTGCPSSEAFRPDRPLSRAILVARNQSVGLRGAAQLQEAQTRMSLDVTRSTGGYRRLRRPVKFRVGLVSMILALALAAGTSPLLSSCSGGSGGAAVTPAPSDSSTFPLPRRIVVSVAPYASVDDALRAGEGVDWTRDRPRSRAITMAYAASELRDHLAMAGIDASISAAPASPTQPAIVLWSRDGASPDPSAPPADLPVTYESLGDQGYAVTPRGGSVYVTANDRIGLLNGVYGLLEQLGFAWYDPYETTVPAMSLLTRRIPWTQTQSRPRVNLRGFWTFGDADLPDEFAVWLARNRLNIAGRADWRLTSKLGLKGWGGGHDLLQQEFSRPGLFEQHPDWFALIDGVRQPVAATGNYFNPSFASSGAADYFAERLIDRLESADLRGIDVVNIWPTDDRFNRFDQSEAAAALGNETDNLLNFYANVGRRLREAHAEGRLSRPVRVAGISYFLTMNPPSNRSIVQDLVGTDYLHLFFPIDRDWSGPIDADLAGRDTNRKLMADLAAWQSVASLDYGIVEYHNLSVYGAVGLTDSPYFAANFAKLAEGRDGLYAYMHPLLRNPGPRRLTNQLLAKLTWEDTSGTGAGIPLVQAGERVIGEYFQRRYGAQAAEWRAIHDLMSQSVENARELFGINSLSWLLLQEQIWAAPFYTRTQVVEYLPRFRDGGMQDLPAAFSGVTTQRATFRGLDDSIRLQTEAAARWRTLLAAPIGPVVRRHMESDIEWFEATASRYRLMSATCDYVAAREHGADVTGPRTRVMREVEFLRQSRVVEDTVSPVDQRGFLELHALLVAHD